MIEKKPGEKNAGQRLSSQLYILFHACARMVGHFGECMELGCHMVEKKQLTGSRIY